MNSNLIYIQSQILCIIFFVILLWYNIKFEYKRKNIVKNIYIQTIFVAAVDILRCLINGSNNNILIHIANILYLSAFGIIGYLWFDYCLDKFGIDLSKNRGIKVLKALPAVLTAILVIISSRTGWIYYVDENGLYSQGSYIFLMLIDYLYVVMTWILGGVKIKNTKSERKKNSYLFLSLLTAPTALAGLMQLFLFKNGLSLVTYSILISMLILFINMQYKRTRIDNLTKLLNRYGMDDAIHKQIEQYKKDKNDLFYVIACDMDNFKHINDTWGHLEGDRALMLISDVLARVAQEYNSNAFRIGGDEFIIIVDTSEDKLPKEICNRLKEELDDIDFRNDFIIKMSMGIARFDGTSQIEELLNRADMQLYEAKRKSKQVKII